jgi:hypothetical protein
MTSLDELIRLRNFAKDLCAPHAASVLAFQCASKISFRIDSEEKDDTDTLRLQHLTSSATCLESLLECRDPDVVREARGWAGQYSVAALERPDDEWKSEGSARVYCRCRGLPLIVREMTPDAGKRDIVARHIDYILQQLGSNRHAIGEADIGNPGNSYPANAFHTYWTLEILENFCERWQPSNESYLREKANLMLLWARQQLGVQIALHEAASSELDTDQLAWAIIVHVRFVPSLASNLMERHLLARGLKCLFAQQQESGSWRRHRPLFHYEKAGNAY